ncbi:MAG TPA: ribonuclease HIII [Methanosarcinaceae archaeon]|nr:ribonuclease HIII [Methanosarcinaceae archaeon]HJH31350.1 ribonuclease HIII [Methanosarcinaceae archaeon]
MSDVLLIEKFKFINLESHLKRNNFSFETRPNAVFLAKKEGITVTLYKSGKLLITGKNVDDFKAYCLENFCHQTKFVDKSQIDSSIQVFEARIGTDESGKGDYFGHLSIAGVFVDSENTEQKLIDIGVKDSKLLSDTSIVKLDKQIKKLCRTSTISISPNKYNELYTKLENLNKLLAWGHARAIENLLQVNDCEKVISDQFGDEKLIENALMKNGKKIDLIQMPHAESDVAVAAASIIARAEFLRRLTEMSRKYKVTFPKGASDKTIEVGKELVKKYETGILHKVAKIHFKTTNKIIGN